MSKKKQLPEWYALLLQRAFITEITGVSKWETSSSKGSLKIVPLYYHLTLLRLGICLFDKTCSLSATRTLLCKIGGGENSPGEVKL